MPEQCAGVVETETRLTSVLVDMEQRGVRVDPSQLKLAEVQIISRLFEIDEELTDLVGRPFRPHVSGDCYDVLCCQYGLPVVEWTEEDEDTGEPAGNPSFNKHALKKYLSHPYAPREVVKRILEYRTLNQQRNLFVAPYQELHVDGIMHGSHNQVVRTGRLSMKAPNMQQLDKFAKDLILTRPGCSFLSADYSQIEFRTIVHYIKDESAIAAYLADPDTDFHQWLADAIGIQRRPAKTINFMIAFGGGKKKTLTSLETNEDVVKQIRDEVERTGGGVKEFEELCREKAEKTYRDYHDALPGIKRTSRAAAMAAEVRGYVFNLAGRRRHLPAESAHIAFNTLNQSSAADIIKERMVALHALLQGTDVHMVLSVHDELVLEGPSELMHDPRLVRDVTNVMEHPAIQLRVPLRVSYGVGDRSWLEAGSQELKLAYDPASCEGLQWLRDGAGLYSHDSALERDTSDTLA
jgi:DNA polymerase-1